MDHDTGFTLLEAMVAFITLGALTHGTAGGVQSAASG